MIDINNSTKQELLTEYDNCIKDWSKYSCDCFGFYIQALHNKITSKGGWKI